jgi:hypothetical protein
METGYFRVRDGETALFETLAQDDAIGFAQKRCADTRGACIPEIEWVPAAPVDHRQQPKRAPKSKKAAVAAAAAT